MLLTLPTVLHTLISYFFVSSSEPDQPRAVDAHLTFQLRQSHVVAPDTHRIVFSNVHSPSSLSQSPETQFDIPYKHSSVPRPSSQADFDAARLRSQQHAVSVPLDWWDTDIIGPDVQNRQTLLQLAKMTFNSYSNPKDAEWYDLSPEWNSTYPFGWEPSADGFRGHVFATEDNSTVVVSIKGTSAGWIAGGGGPTTHKDKLNDNLLFSCCCARVGPTWYPVCGCYAGSGKCDQNCVEKALIEDSLFYPIGTNLYKNITYLYPDSNIWIVGHSLGGALASLLGTTFGAPVVAFESPGEKMAAKRLHLPSPPSVQHITHVYHTADSIAMGTCNGVTSSCAIGGYAMESRCHLGNVIRYDTVQELGWAVDVRTHPIKVMIERILADGSEWSNRKGAGDDGNSGEEEGGLDVTGWWGRRGKPDDNRNRNATGDEVPELKSASEVEGDGEGGECSDCFDWEFGDYLNTTTLTYRNGC